MKRQQQNILSVSQLNRYVKSLLEENPLLGEVYIRGELSNVVDHYRSGHLYFTLKDEEAAIKAVMFKSFASYLRFRPENGMRVLIQGSVSLYEKDGSYQLYARDIQPDGLGALHLAYEQLLVKLHEEGLFAPERKKSIPVYPKTIAVVTSQSAAALQDVLNILERRYPVCTVRIVPVAVQGYQAAPSIVEALQYINEEKLCDTIILCRGGGSLEELWAFNEEMVVRAVAASKIPIISAIGHETDTTLTDHAADLRAPTPSAAAEIAVPDLVQLKYQLSSYRAALPALVQGHLTGAKSRLESLKQTEALKNPHFFIVQNRHRTENLVKLLNDSRINILQARADKLGANLRLLESLSPLKTLSRGYSITHSGDKLLTSVHSVKVGDTVTTMLEDGQIKSKVVTIDEKEADL